MKLSEWARKNNLAYQTAHRLFKKPNSISTKVKCMELFLGTHILIYENVRCASPSDTQLLYLVYIVDMYYKEDLP